MGVGLVNGTRRGSMTYSRELLRSLFMRSSAQSFLVPWNESNRSSETYLTMLGAQAAQEAMKMPRPCLNSWITFETPLPAIK